MRTSNASPANEKRTAQLKVLLAEVLADVLRRGFHGSAGIELSIQDGTIQNIRRRIEQIER